MKITGLQNLTLAFLLASSLISCDRPVVSREYEEITLESPLEHMHAQEDPHAHMHDSSMVGADMSGDLPEGHPDISSSLPEGHPDISGSGSMGTMPTDPQMQQALAASVAQAPLTWKAPEGWSEEPGNSMRAATFRAQDDAGAIECSIVTLGGPAGGFESNVIRWMTQVKIATPAPEALKQFLSKQEVITTEGGFEVTMIDLTEYTKEDAAPSMIGAIAEQPQLTIFVKMTGAKKSLLANKEKFKALCQSLKLK